MELTETDEPKCVHLVVNNTYKLESIWEADYGWNTLIASAAKDSVQHNVI